MLLFKKMYRCKMNLKIVNVNTTGFRINLKDKNLIDLFDKLESNPQECSK